jgi:hypothetical protein
MDDFKKAIKIIASEYGERLPEPARIKATKVRKALELLILATNELKSLEQDLVNPQSEVINEIINKVDDARYSLGRIGIVWISS